MLILIGMMISSPASAATFAVGDGSAGNPYQISTIEQLQNMSTALSANYILINDIDASETISWNSNAGFVPIGSSSSHFTGSFNGSGYVITGLHINRPSTSYIGLFGYVGSSSELNNVWLEHVNITGVDYVGGLVGWNDGSVIQSHSNGNITGFDYVGGLVGVNLGSVDQSYSTGDVSGDYDVGGLLGYNDFETVSNSYSTCNVTGISIIGGLVGECWDGEILNSYSAGYVTGSDSVGGLVGYDMFELISTNSYWDTQTSGQSTSPVGTGKTTAEMKTQSTFVGWDFSSIWSMDDSINSGYPYLLQLPPVSASEDVQNLTSLLAVPLNETDFTFASSEFVEGINVEFNTSSDNVDLTLMSTMNIVKLTGALDNDVWVRIYVDGASEPVLEEKMRSLSKDRSNIDEGSTGTRPISFTIPSSGTHNITYEFNRTGNGAVEVNDIDITLLKFVTAEGNQVREQLTDVSYSHSSTTFNDAFNWSVEKSVESGTFVIGKYSLSSDLESVLQYYYKDLNSGDTSTSWSRHQGSAFDVGSVSGIFVDQVETSSTNYSIFSKSSGVNTNVVGKVLDFDLKDSGAYEISSFSVSNEGTDASNDLQLPAGTHLLATESVTVYNGTGYFLAMTSSFSSLSGSQTPTYFINCTQVPDCYSKKERYLMSDDDIGNAFIYYTTGGLTPGETYNFNLWVTVEEGEVLEQIDEVLAGFEISEFDITFINTAPHVAIIAPEPDAYISGTFYVNASVTDNNEDAFVSNISLSNTTGDVGGYISLPQDVSSVTFDSTQFADGIYNITWVACENETAEKFCSSNVIGVTIDNNAPFIDFNDETTDEGNFSQSYIVGNISVSDMWLNASGIYLYNNSGPVDSSISADSTHSVTFSDLADGYYQLNASAWDYAGNTNETETRSILLDTTDPVIVFNEDTTAEGNFSQNSIFANVTSFDVFGYSSLTISLYNESSLVDSSTTEGNGNLSNEFTGLADGVYYLNATVVDLAGNTNTTSTMEITLDTVKPAIDFNDETTDEGNFSQNYIVGNISVSDMWLNASGIYLYNSSGVVDSSISADSTHSVTFSDLADGYYQLNASVWDYAGNTNETETRSILLDTTDPVIVFNEDTTAEGNFSQTRIFANVTSFDVFGYSSLTISLYNESSLVDSSTTEGNGNLSNEFTSLADGVYYLNATVVDLAGNTNTTSTLEITLDTVKPAIDFNDETTDEGNFSQSYIVGNISVSDMWLNASGIYLYNSSGVVDSSISADSTHSVTFSDLADGYYQLNASVWDYAGNTNETETRSILLDTTDPVIVFNEDTTAEGNFSQTRIFANVTSFDVFGYSSLTISLYNESSLVASSTTEGNGNLSNEFTSLADGVYYLNATVFDLAGNTNTTSTLEITLDTAKPAIDFNDETTDEGNFSQNYIVGNISVSDMWLNASGIYLYNSSGPVDSSISADSTHSVTFSDLADGYYQLNASAWDYAGNTNETETRSILLDTTDPVIVFNEDTTAEGNFSHTSIFANVTSFDLFGYSSLTISLYNESSLVDSSTTTGLGNLSHEFTGLADGVYYLNATVADLAGNTNTTSTLEIKLDTVKPAIDFNDETTDEGNFSQSYIVGNISVSDMWLNASGIYLYNSSGLVDSSISADSTHSVTFSDLADGYYQLNASVWDYAGNTNETETRSILLDTTDPLIVFNEDTTAEGNFSHTSIFANVTSFDLFGYSSLTISLYNESSLVDSSTTEGNGNLSNEFTGLADGVYYLNATVVDLAGNTNTTSTLEITLDTAKPAIDFNDETTDAGNFSQSYIVGNISVSDMWLNASGIYLYNSSGVVDSSISAEPTHSVTFSGLADDYYQLNASVWDYAGNTNETETRSILLDTTDPVIVFNDDVLPSGNFSQDWVFANVTASDNMGIRNVTIYLYNSTGLFNSTSYPGSLSVNFTSLQSGMYYLNATVEDLGGNIVPIGPIAYGIDAIDMKITNVTASQVTDRSATISWKTNEAANSTVYYGLDSNVSMNASKAVFGTDHSIMLTGLQDETLYYYKVVSYDIFGFNNSSQISNFTTVKTSTGGGSSDDNGLPNYYYFQDLKEKQENEAACSALEASREFDVGDVMSGDTVEIDTLDQLKTAGCMVTGVDINLGRDVDDMDVTITQSSSSS
ncbi:fibronectin type III domain-containing protein [Methanococcoides orientis]|uniref:Ig-like domain-containing protein n=1 Tax=Methanococcoides orientis TaxID=2822137 RepID=UPI001E2EB813|nr:Ig-like domain-containing protein [Methanococcoides orientis]UGV41697.1 fibronectin type III domain-containing protein [Methanococcoides orientis]